MTDIPARVSRIICSILGVTPDQVTPEAAIIRDLGADSLDTIEVVMALEEEFGIEIVGDAIREVTRLNNAIA